MIDGRNVFGQPVKSNTRTYQNFRKNDLGQRDEYTTGWLLGYTCF